MFTISLDYQSSAGTVKRSRVKGAATFRGRTTGLALKYVVTGRERYFWEDQELDIHQGEFLLLPVGAEYRAVPGTADVTTEGVCVDLHLAHSDEAIQFLYGGVFRANHWGKERSVNLHTRPDQTSADQFNYFQSDIMEGLHQYAEVGRRITPDARREATRRELCKSLFAAHRHLEENFTESISLRKLGQVARLSKFHLSRLFSRAFGITPLVRQTELRMEKAAELIRADQYGLTEIAHRLGYADMPTFSRQFRKTYGLPPSRWAREHIGDGRPRPVRT